MDSRVVRAFGIVGVVWSVLTYIDAPSFPTPDKIVVFTTFIFMSIGQAKAMLKRILPFVLLLLAYESFRGIVPKINDHVSYLLLPAIDRLMTGGTLPTEALQQWWWNGRVQWFDFALYLTYMLHFVLPFGLAFVIWKKRERYYWQYVAAFVGVSFAGFLTFLAFPAAPPWMSSDMNLIEPIHRISSDVWYALGVHDFPSVYNKITPNTVAAMPSLHAAYATLFALFVTKLWRSKYRYIAWLYPAMIYLGTVYMGEHYVIDEIAGAFYALAAYVAAPHLVRLVRKMGRIMHRYAGRARRRKKAA